MNTNCVTYFARIGHVQGHVTVTYKVTLECQGVDLYSAYFSDQK